MKRIVSAFLAGAMALSLAACGGASSTAASSTASSAAAGSAAASAVSDADSDLAYIQSNGKMVIGYTVYEPMNYTDADGNFTGFDTELATAVCEKLAWSRSSWRSTGTPRRPSWPPRASTASGTA